MLWSENTRVKSALSHLGIVEDSKGIAKAMEEETEVEEAFSKSGKLMTKLMEQVDGISCGKNGKREGNKVYGSTVYS